MSNSICLNMMGTFCYEFSMKRANSGAHLWPMAIQSDHWNKQPHPSCDMRAQLERLIHWHAEELCRIPSGIHLWAA